MSDAVLSVFDNLDTILSSVLRQDWFRTHSIRPGDNPDLSPRYVAL